MNHRYRYFIDHSIADVNADKLSRIVKSDLITDRKCLSVRDHELCYSQFQFDFRKFDKANELRTVYRVIIINLIYDVG